MKLSKILHTHSIVNNFVLSKPTWLKVGDKTKCLTPGNFSKENEKFQINKIRGIYMSYSNIETKEDYFSPDYYRFEKVDN